MYELLSTVTEQTLFELKKYVYKSQTKQTKSLKLLQQFKNCRRSINLFNLFVKLNT